MSAGERFLVRVWKRTFVGIWEGLVMTATTTMDGGSAENAGAIFCRPKADILYNIYIIDIYSNGCDIYH